MLFKILHGDDAYISLDIVPFHEGYCYVTYGGNLYIDMNTGTASEPNNQRIQLNAANAQTLCGMTLEEIKASIDSSAIVDVDTLPTNYIVEECAQVIDGTVYRDGDVAPSGRVVLKLIVVDSLPDDAIAFSETNPIVATYMLRDGKGSAAPYVYFGTLLDEVINEWRLQDYTVYQFEDQVPDDETQYMLYRETQAEPINENVIYRLNINELGAMAEGVYLPNGLEMNGASINIVVFDTLPDISELTPSEATYYIQTSDNTAWYYPNSEQGLMNLADMMGGAFGGIVSSKDQAIDTTKVYFIYNTGVKLYHYKDGWHEIGGDDFIQPDWTQTDETAKDYIKNKPTLGALASKDAIGLIYDEENESLSIEYGVHLAPGEEEAVPVTEMRVNQIVDESVTASEERMTALIEEAINGALEGEY